MYMHDATAAVIFILQRTFQRIICTYCIFSKYIFKKVIKAGTPIVLALANGRPGLSYTTFSYGDIKLSQKPTSSAMKNSQ